MKTLLGNILSFAVFFSCAFGLLVWLNASFLATDHYNNEFTVKGNLIRQTPSPKVVFVGGSNVAFGIDSQTISDSIGLPVINAGLLAGMGLRYTMDRYESYFKRGDVLILMPEYDHFYGDVTYGNPETAGYLPYLSDFDPSLLNLKQWNVVVTGFFKTTLQISVKGLYYKLLHSFRKEGNVFEYKMSGFNRLGDEVSHRSLPPNINNTGAYTVSGKFNAGYARHLFNQVRRLQHHGVQVLWLPPVTSRANVALNRKQITLIIERMKTAGFTYAACPDSLAYPDSLLYNTVYHLNKQGVEVNTQRVVCILRHCLGVNRKRIANR